jgi:PIN domain nuclease of toxin-antitoxin system
LSPPGTVLCAFRRALCGTRLFLWRHRFDRLLLAQALAEPLKLITADAALEPYSDLVVRV